MQNASMQIFDTSRKHQNRMRGNSMQGDFDFLRAEIADRMSDRLLEINRKFENILDLGGDFARLTGRDAEHIILSDDPLPIEANSYDMITSNLCFHWANDLTGILIQLNRALKPDGLLLASMFGGTTLHELRHSFLAAEAEITGGASARIIPFAEVKDVGSLLQRAGFALPVTDMDTITVTYEHPLKLMQELRGMGEANALFDRPKNFLRRDVMMRACEIYQEQHSNPDGRIRATFQILYLTGWHPHESQQKPLKPGSAQMSLADALKAGGKPPVK
ncbi:methyltransferase domain-containing protein [Kordiimonas sp. SCSIO 12603]|uniref:methyltransferase domain-containing protein n=1 Tax=Kordiimonas sp. SCSIO 12603 TaxID=2829596 RepID=UPI002104F77F|nr:methyltransferase domain-containing protein [Kordiimonas sp. SCSIO 12603]UTW59486.1 methyltransferase domain-containing protein [Kordiimonas sp. SCSIO 12603]